jgi:hypothetical protein
MVIILVLDLFMWFLEVIYMYPVEMDVGREDIISGMRREDDSDL